MGDPWVSWSCQGLQGSDGDVEQVVVGAEPEPRETPRGGSLPRQASVRYRTRERSRHPPHRGLPAGRWECWFSVMALTAPQTRRLKIAESALSQSGARGLKSRCGQGRAHLRLRVEGRVSFLPLPAPGRPWACGHIPVLSAPVFTRLLPWCVSLL